MKFRQKKKFKLRRGDRIIAVYKKDGFQQYWGTYDAIIDEKLFGRLKCVVVKHIGLPPTELPSMLTFDKHWILEKVGEEKENSDEIQALKATFTSFV